MMGAHRAGVERAANLAPSHPHALRGGRFVVQFAHAITPAWKFLTLSPSVSEDPHNINTSPDIRFPIRDRFGTTDPASVAR